MKNFQRDRLWVIPVILLAWSPYFMGAWDKAKPADDVTMDDAMAEIRANWTVLETAIGAEHVFTSVSQTGAHTTITASGNATISGGSVTIGVDGTKEGVLELFRKDTNEFSYIKMDSSDGTPFYFFVDDTGDLRMHTAVPTSTADGSVVGSQS